MIKNRLIEINYLKVDLEVDLQNSLNSSNEKVDIHFNFLDAFLNIIDIALFLKEG